MRNALCGTDFFLANVADDKIVAWEWQQSTNGFIKGNVATEGSDSEGILVKRISEQENRFLAYNTKKRVFREFMSDGRGRVMYNVREVSFSQEPDFMGQKAFASPIGFFMRPVEAEGEHQLITLDYKAVL